MMMSFRVPRRFQSTASILIVILLLLAVAGLVMRILPISEKTSAGLSGYSGKTEEDRQAFIAELGWEVEAEPVGIGSFVIENVKINLLGSIRAAAVNNSINLTRT